ncbi:MAG: ABC transporter ATP-binding protein [Bacteroidales bacterium]|nr:ABC transporter ATP-binding protein [Bacteroidales bacterium]
MPPFQQNGSRHDGMRGGGGATLKDLRNIGTVKRLFAFIMKNYKVHIGIVLVCIVISSVTSLASSLFTRSLIDDYITPMLSSSALGSALGPDYHPLAIALVKLGAIILAGVIAGYAYNMIMIFVGQGTMRKLRESLFYKMEKLPLSYFDSHAHGDIMSVYTNDIDTLRQVIGNSVPRLFQSLITIVATFISMIVLSIPLTVIAVIMAFVMFKVTTSLGKISRKYFTERQKNLGIMNGFIEEMVSGQKVVKVYSHEKKAME